MEDKSKVYILIDEEGRILRCDGGYSISNVGSGWVLIDEGDGYRYNLCQSHYFNGGLYTDDGICRYKYVNERCILRSDSEIEEERQSRPAPYDERLDMISALNELGVQ